MLSTNAIPKPIIPIPIHSGLYNSEVATSIERLYVLALLSFYFEGKNTDIKDKLDRLEKRCGEIIYNDFQVVCVNKAGKIISEKELL